jgi:Meiotically up-regulated gene 113
MSLRFYFFGGPKILGFRSGISFNLRDLTRTFAGTPSIATTDIGKPFVYVIRGEHGRSKVGCTGNPNRRLNDLRTASAFPLRLEFIGIPQSGDGEKIEQCVHDMLDRFRVTGEWFTCTPELCISAIYGAASRYNEKLVQLTPEQADKTIAAAAGRTPPTATPRLAFRLAIAFACIAVYWLFFAPK